MVLFLAFLFLLSRLINLMALPPYWDEVYYIRWLLTIKVNHDWLLPLKEYGWEPLNIWLAVIVNRLVSDPLLALRLTTAFFGGLSIILAYQAVKLIFNRSAALFTAALMIISPWLLVHDRLGLRGEPIISCVTWLCLIALYQRLIKKKTKAVYLLSLALVVGLLTKTTAMVLLPAIFLSYLFFRPRLEKTDFFAGLISLTPFVFFGLTQTLAKVLAKKEVFVLSWQNLGNLVKPNIIQTGLWLYQYLTWPILLLILLGLLLALKSYQRHNYLLLLLVLPAFGLAMIIGSLFFPRYLVNGVSLLLAYAGLGLSWLYQKLPRLLKPLLMVIFLPCLFLDWQIVKDMRQAKIPELERWQYITGWPSGYAIKDLSDYLKTDLPELLVTEPNDIIPIGISYYWPEFSFKMIRLTVDYQLPPDFQLAEKTYVISNDRPSPVDSLEVELIKEFPRPENKSTIKLYKIISIN